MPRRYGDLACSARVPRLQAARYAIEGSNRARASQCSVSSSSSSISRAFSRARRRWLTCGRFLSVISPTSTLTQNASWPYTVTHRKVSCLVCISSKLVTWFRHIIRRLCSQTLLVDTAHCVCFAGCVHCAKRNVMVWCPSVCPSYQHTHCRATHHGAAYDTIRCHIFTCARKLTKWPA